MAVFDVEEVEPRRIQGELEGIALPRARLRIESRSEERGVRRQERRLVVLHPDLDIGARRLDPETRVRVRAELFEDVDPMNAATKTSRGRA